MKTLISTLIFVCLAVSSILAQSNSNVTFFTPEGEPFTLVLNGSRINDKPQTSVTAKNVAGRLFVKVIFEDADLGEISDKCSVGEYEAVGYKIQANKKGVYQIKRSSYDELARPEPVVQTPPPAQQQPTQVVFGVVINNGNSTNNSRSNCYVADGEMTGILKSIRNEIGSSSKLTVAMDIIRSKNQCLTTLQMRRIILILTFDDDRLKLAKYGYDYVNDRPNYYSISDVFSSPFRKDEFNQFLKYK